MRIKAPVFLVILLLSFFPHRRKSGQFRLDTASVLFSNEMLKMMVVDDYKSKINDGASIIEITQRKVSAKQTDYIIYKSKLGSRITDTVHLIIENSNVILQYGGSITASLLLDLKNISLNISDPLRSYGASTHSLGIFITNGLLLPGDTAANTLVENCLQKELYDINGVTLVANYGDCEKSVSSQHISLNNSASLGAMELTDMKLKSGSDTLCIFQVGVMSSYLLAPVTMLLKITPGNIVTAASNYSYDSSTMPSFQIGLQNLVLNKIKSYIDSSMVGKELGLSVSGDQLSLQGVSKQMAWKMTNGSFRIYPQFFTMTFEILKQ